MNRLKPLFVCLFVCLSSVSIYAFDDDTQIINPPAEENSYVYFDVPLTDEDLSQVTGEGLGGAILCATAFAAGGTALMFVKVAPMFSNPITAPGGAILLMGGTAFTIASMQYAWAFGMKYLPF